jgi:hypothetical protein
MPVARRQEGRATIEDILQAKKRLFVSAILQDDNLSTAARKSGMSLEEARTFRGSPEYMEMTTYLWDNFFSKHITTGSKKLFIALVDALDSLNMLVLHANPELRLRAIAELRQWLSNTGKCAVLDKMTSKIMETGEGSDADEESYTPEAAQKAMDFLTELRASNGGGTVRAGSNGAHQN